MRKKVFSLSVADDGLVFPLPLPSPLSPDEQIASRGHARLANGPTHTSFRLSTMAVVIETHARHVQRSDSQVFVCGRFSVGPPQGLGGFEMCE